MNIYIANLDNAIDNNKLTELFSPFGEVRSAEVVKDVFTGASRGFGYVQMDDEAAQTAIGKLNQTVLNSLVITVEEAPVKKEQKGSYKVGNGAVNVYRFKKN
jgi:RNA recognition motif-containing protein